MKYKIALGVMGTFIAFQGVTAVPEVGGGNDRLGNRSNCMNCHVTGASKSGEITGARELTPDEIAAGVPQDKHHQFSEAELYRFRVDKAEAREPVRTGVVDNDRARKLA